MRDYVLRSPFALPFR